MGKKNQQNFQLAAEQVADLRATASRLSEVMAEPIELSFIAAVALEQFLALPDSRKVAMLAGWKAKRLEGAIKLLQQREKGAKS